MTFAAAAASGYGIQVRYVGSVSAPMQEAVSAAVAKWTRAVIGDVADVSVNLPAGSCAGVSYSALREVVDDLLIFVQVVAIDGPGKTLGSSAPCYVRSTGRLPILGGIKLDAADVSQMDAQGTLADVVLHEIGHILGIGTLWSEFSLLVDAGTSTVSFTGTRATEAFQAAGGSNWLGVPVENTGGTGTRDSHWRESSLGNELMTGFIDLGTNPLSAISIASLGDLSYTVDLAAADGFSVVAAARAAPAGTAIELLDDVAPEPLFEIDENGVVRPVQPR
ncbi:MAG: peptidase [Gemmatimonadetes bacterium]|nr:peptidase [Gemmatimonadota bacterium]